ncbi:MAG: DUF2249 domain-containing protein [Chitinophagaceae bacterium]|nr:MAG: DUF2249 domain-containing protein [Chitinophagaceae bacterium]
MISIHSNTKIAELLKQHPAALEAIIAIHPRLEKLRNPLLRKLMAGRTSIAMAAKVAGCEIERFYEALLPLGFVAGAEGAHGEKSQQEVPAFMKALRPGQVVELDVRNIIEAGNDPLPAINKIVKSLKAGRVLKLIHIFEPVPLMHLLQQQGFVAHADFINDNLVETYFYKQPYTASLHSTPEPVAGEGWEEMLHKYAKFLHTVDVRDMQMPLPMMAILEALNTLPGGAALHVYHKRIPVFLLPELNERQLDYRIKEVSEGNVELLIFRP